MGNVVSPSGHREAGLAAPPARSAPPADAARAATGRRWACLGAICALPSASCTATGEPAGGSAWPMEQRASVIGRGSSPTTSPPGWSSWPPPLARRCSVPAWAVLGRDRGSTSALCTTWSSRLAAWSSCGRLACCGRPRRENDDATPYPQRSLPPVAAEITNRYSRWARHRARSGRWQRWRGTGGTTP